MSACTPISNVLATPHSDPYLVQRTVDGYILNSGDGRGYPIHDRRLPDSRDAAMAWIASIAQMPWGTRQMILSVALAVLEHEGLAGVPIDIIAERAIHRARQHHART